MKKCVIFSIFLMVIILPCMASANFVIILKNGSEIITDQYWEEGEQIKFFRYGGITGVNRQVITQIKRTTKETDKEIISIQSSAKEAGRPEQPKTAPGEASEKNLDPANPGQSILQGREAGPVKPAKAEITVEDPYLREFKDLKSRFEHVRFQEDPALYAYAKELTNFRDKILNERLGHLYSDQIVEIYSLLAGVESIIKSN